jgi:hypothetical protein
LTDTSRPTLSNGGKGLLNCDFIFLKHQDETFLFKLGGGKNPVLVKGTFTEADLEILKNNMLFIEKQYNIQIKEWIRNDKWDLNLGEAIKGFYMKPIY